MQLKCGEKNTIPELKHPKLIRVSWRSISYNLNMSRF